MKKFLQKTFALLALAIMFMASASAWAETVVFDFNNGDQLGDTKSVVTVTGATWNQWQNMGYYHSGGTQTITIESDTDIESVEFDNSSYSWGAYYTSNWTTTAGSLSCNSDRNHATLTLPEGITSVTVGLKASSGTNVNVLTVKVKDAAPAEPQNYSVVVAGTTDANAGVVYKGVTYHNGETLPGVVGLTASKVSAAPVTGYEATVTLDGDVFTVTYKKPEYITLPTTSSSNTVDGVTISGSTYNGYLNLYYYSGGSWSVTVTSATYPIEKIELFGDTFSCSVSCGSYSNNVWTCNDGDYYSVVFTPTSGDKLVTSARVWLKEPTITPAPEFPKEDTGYMIQNTNGSCYLNLQSHATYAAVLKTESEPLYFTWDENKAAFTIKDAEGNYMGKSSANTWNMDSSAPEYWTVEEISTGVYAFKCKSTDKYLGFNSTTDGSNGFRDKDYNANYGLFTIAPFAVAPVATFNMSAAGWATLCVLDAFTVPDGYEAYVVGKEVNREAVAVENGELVMTRIYDVPEQVAVLITGAPAENIELFAPDATPAMPSVNFLKGNPFTSNYPMSSDMFTSIAPTDDPLTYDYIDQYGAGSRIYKLSYLNGENLGFYFDAEGGVSYTVKANRACLVLPAAQANSNGFKIRFTEDDVTGINAVATEKAEAIYNLQGQRVNATKAGVYVKNGKKFIVK